MSELVIRVVGEPAPQGSKRHIGGGRLVEMSKKVKPWRQDVTAAALVARIAADDLTFTGPVSLEATFTLKRPAGHYRTGANAGLLRDSAPAVPAVTPDLDKLVRSTLDALTLAGVWRDDSQVCELLVRKCYPGLGLDALDTPGAVLRVHPMKATIADVTGAHAEAVIARMPRQPAVTS